MIGSVPPAVGETARLPAQLLAWAMRVVRADIAMTSRSRPAAAT